MKNESAFLNRPVRIVIIDSGIDKSKSNLSEFVTEEITVRIDENGKIYERKMVSFTHEHGTAVSIIIKTLCSNVEFVSINILDENLLADGRVLIYALSRAFDFNPDIIHMSLGTPKLIYKFQLRKLVCKANKNNISIVAATSNDGKKCYPAYIRGVIGVKALYPKSNIYNYTEGFFYASSNPENIPDLEKLKNNFIQGTSMSAACITGYLSCNLSEKGVSKNEALSYMKKHG